MSWYTKLFPSIIALPCIIIVFSIVVNCHQTSVFVSLNHFPIISVTLLVTGSTKIDSRLNLWQNISPVSVSMAEMTRPSSVSQYSVHTVMAVSFIYMHMGSASKSDGYKHIDTSNLASHAIEMPCHRKYQGFPKCLNDAFSSFLQLISFGLSSYLFLESSFSSKHTNINLG